jgi:hypothetical protein
MLPTESLSHFITPTRPCHHSIDWDLHFTLSLFSPDHSPLDLQEWSLNLLLYSRPRWLSAKKTEGSSHGIHLGDVLIGSAVIELSPLCSGFPLLDGWYHVMDNAHRSIGQMKLVVSLESNSKEALLCPSPEPPPSLLPLYEQEEGEPAPSPGLGSDLSQVLASIIQNLENATSSLLKISSVSSPLRLLNEDTHPEEDDEEMSGGDSEAKAPQEELDWDLNSLTSSSSGEGREQEELAGEIPETPAADGLSDSFSVLSEQTLSVVLAPPEEDPVDAAQENLQIPVDQEPLQEIASPSSEDGQGHHEEEEDHQDEVHDDFGGRPYLLSEESEDERSDLGSSVQSDDLAQGAPEPPREDDDPPREDDDPPPDSPSSLPDVAEYLVLEESMDLPDSLPRLSSESPVQEEDSEGSSVVSGPDSPQHSESGTEESAEELLSLLNIVAEHSDDQSAPAPNESQAPPEESKPMAIPPPKPTPMAIAPFSPIVPPPPPVTLSTILSDQVIVEPTPSSAPSHRCNLSKDVRDLSDVIRTVMKSTQVHAKWEKSPGRRRQFLDAETERITKAMKVSLGEYSRAANPRSPSSP